MAIPALTASADITVDTGDKETTVSQKAHHPESGASTNVRIRVGAQTGATSYRKAYKPNGPTTAAAPTRVEVRNCAADFRAGTPCNLYTLPTAGGPKAKAKAKKKQDPKAPKAVQVSPQELALMAVAELRLPAVAPGIGPDPSINQWKMAAVGYPLWLWADGPSHVGPVSQRVANLYVSLDARLTSVTYAMGDGHTVTCDGPGARWDRSVPAGKPSSCGYRYQKPSLPKGSYTVRAVSHWDITWVVGGESGVLTMDQEGTRQLPVGELQVLIR